MNKNSCSEIFFWPFRVLLAPKGFNFYRIVLTKGDMRLVHSLVSADGFQSIDGGEAGASATKTVAKGTQVSISATAAQYCVFRQWSDSSDDNPHTVTVNEDMTLTGTFETNV